MNNIAIGVTNLSKKYKIGALRQRHDTLRDEVAHGFKSLFGRNGRRPTAGGETLWALKDVSFEVTRGEVLGIIGQNGAGKSTLLEDTFTDYGAIHGPVRDFGRVGSLLEVGTGFHGELTGRENLYLNGAILGMKKTEIDRNFDEIVAFAEVEKFIDTPVKRYSSGMLVRLAFAVAAHLRPEILIIDEVLAVGDLNFQTKCLGKLGAVARQGRTVLFVSHNVGAVTNLCTTGMWIDQGQIQMRGEVKSVVDAYIRQQSQRTKGDAQSWKRSGTGDAKIVGVRLSDSRGSDCTAFMMGETIVLEFDVEFYRALPNVNFTVEVSRKEMSMRVLHMQNDDCGFGVHQVVPGTRRFRVEIPNCMLYPTSYEIMMCIWDRGTVMDYVEGVVEFSMIQSDVTRRTSSLTIHRQAIYYTPSVWKDIPIPDGDRQPSQTSAGEPARIC